MSKMGVPNDSHENRFVNVEVSIKYRMSHTINISNVQFDYIYVSSMKTLSSKYIIFI